MNNRHKELADVQVFARAVAERRGWVLNPDTEFRDRILGGLATNYNRYGFFLCPCRDGDGDRVAEKDIACPCAYAGPDVAEHGHCFCALYLAPDCAARVQQGASLAGIPERRNAPAGSSGN